MAFSASFLQKHEQRQRAGQIYHLWYERNAAGLASLGSKHLAVSDRRFALGFESPIEGLSRQGGMVVGIRTLACLLLALPILAHAQFSLVATQVGPKDEALGDPYAATCAKDACRVTLPVTVGNAECVLNVRVSAPNHRGAGNIVFAAGPCQGGFRVGLDSRSFLYQLDGFGAMSDSYTLPFVPLAASSMIDGAPGVNDLVLRPSARIRLDLIASRTR